MATYNDCQPPTTRQLPGVAVGETKVPELADWKLVEKCRHRLDAIVLCVQLSGLSHEEVAARLNIDKGAFSRMMGGRASFPDTKSIRLYQVCGNYAPLQYEAWACNFDLVDKALLAAIKARAA